jgi:hypothetical protein
MPKLSRPTIVMLLMATNLLAHEPVSEKARQRAETLRSNVTTFQLALDYAGPEEKPFYRLRLTVPRPAGQPDNPFYRVVHIDKQQALTLVDYLARDGFLDRATQRPDGERPAQAATGYVLSVSAGDLTLVEPLGWDLAMLRRLDGLRDALPERAHKDMELLLGRLSGVRDMWEQEQFGLAAQARRPESRIRFSAQGEATIVEIASPAGIDTAVLRRTARQWPRSVVVRLRLRGLESFKAGGEQLAVEWSVSSTGKHPVHVYLSTRDGDRELPESSPYFTRVRIVGGDGTLPQRDGYFEVPLPEKLFEGNPEVLTLQWVDFYR